MSNFFIVGAQRSGSTYLYKMLDEHPEICMAKPIKPEPKYFLNKKTDVSINEYKNTFFSSCPLGSKIFGEKSTSYYEKEASAYLISKTFPDAKILFILRDPVNRALSNYAFSIENGLENRSVEDALLHEDLSEMYPSSLSVNPFSYKKRGLYFEYIKVYLKYFDSNKIKILILEETFRDVSNIVDTYSFLGVDSSYIPSQFSQVVNSTEVRLSVSSGVLNHLSEYYCDSISALEDFIGRKIPNWKGRV